MISAYPALAIREKARCPTAAVIRATNRIGHLSPALGALLAGELGPRQPHLSLSAFAHLSEATLGRFHRSDVLLHSGDTGQPQVRLTRFFVFRGAAHQLIVTAYSDAVSVTFEPAAHAWTEAETDAVESFLSERVEYAADRARQRVATYDQTESFEPDDSYWTTVRFNEERTATMPIRFSIRRPEAVDAFLGALIEALSLTEKRFDALRMATTRYERPFGPDGQFVAAGYLEISTQAYARTFPVLSQAMSDMGSADPRTRLAAFTTLATTVTDFATIGRDRIFEFNQLMYSIGNVFVAAISSDAGRAEASVAMLAYVRFLFHYGGPTLHLGIVESVASRSLRTLYETVSLPESIRRDAYAILTFMRAPELGPFMSAGAAQIHHAEVRDAEEQLLAQVRTRDRELSERFFSQLPHLGRPVAEARVPHALHEDGFSIPMPGGRYSDFVGKNAKFAFKIPGTHSWRIFSATILRFEETDYALVVEETLTHTVLYLPLTLPGIHLNMTYRD